MPSIRFGGMASGLDTESIIKDMMRVERLPVDKLKQKKQTLEWQRDSYRETNLLLTSFRDKTLNMRMQSSFTTKITNSSNSDKVTATAAATSGNVSYTLSKVSQLATSATNSSTNSISKSNTDKISTSEKLYSIQDKFQVGTFEWKDTANPINERINVDAGGKEFSFKKSLSGTIENLKVNVSGSEYTVVDELGDLTEGANQVFVDKNTGKVTFSNTLSAGDKINIEYTASVKDTVTLSTKGKEVNLTNPGITQIKSISIDGKEITLDVNGQSTDENYKFSLDKNTGKITFDNELAANTKVEVSYHQEYFEFEMATHNKSGQTVESFKFDGKASLDKVMDTVNKSDLGVNMFYDEYSDSVTMTRTETGNFNEAGNEITFTGSFLTKGLMLSEGNEKGGENAKFTLNGLETQRTSNNFTVNGVTFTLKDTFDSVDGTDAAVTVSVQNDTTKAFDNIKKFVEDYNELIDKLQGTMKEEKYRDYAPLTDEEREALSDDQIEKWEEKAKSGLLRNDQTLSSLLNQMRMDFYTPVEGESDSMFNQLSAIGITTTANYLDGGKLQINEEKLKEALEKDADGVYNLFAADGPTSGEQGIARRLRDSLSNSITTITQRAGNGMQTNSQFTLGKNLDEVNSRITDMEARLVEKEDRFWQQFTAMETAMQKMNDQMNYMMSQLGMGTTA
ncbi:flagellar filament capping protein FliD [Cytobacillus gottheilii]|uniref:flagellar filament capping protein FliD n=1 Tax=Cytobacillus gottheilii TaxID=859144 RepID=UPI00249450FB|nr:flagellar filament capping protein FliD [Cytobacillus gottheilii]